MANRERTDTPIWLELSIDRVGDDVRISARGSRGEQLAFRSLGIAYETLLRFASGVERAANHGRSLTPELLADAQAIPQALTDDEIGLLFGRLEEAAGGPLLVRIIVHDPALWAIPWEATCNLNQARGYWAVSTNLLPVRGILSSSPWQSTIVEGAVRVLAIAPSDGGGLTNLRQALDERIPTGEIEWLEPLTGEKASKRGILERLRHGPFPHVIHFVGHGRVEGGVSALRAADDGDEEAWLDVELFAQEIAANLQGNLQLVVLEACEGARQSAFSSAAEIISHVGVEAVVAHVWPVRANVARTCSTQLYRTLVDADNNAGNIAIAMNDARRAILSDTDSSAEAMSPVLYLRGTESAIFNFENRKLTPIIVAGVGTVGAGIVTGVLKAVTNSPAPVAEEVVLEPSQLESFIHDKPLPPPHPAPNPPSHGSGLAPHSLAEPMNDPTLPEMKAPQITPTLPPETPRSKWPWVAGAIAASTFVAILALSLGNCTPDTPVASGSTTIVTPETTSTNTNPTSTATPGSVQPLPTTVKAPPTTPDTNLLRLSSPCTNAQACKSKFCVDGVCCDNACSGKCQACSVSNGAMADGKCAPISAGSDPAQECGSTGRCDGKGGCGPCPPKALCGLALSQKVDIGAGCSIAAICKSGFCVDGVCCDKSCTGTCLACAVAKGAASNGTCRFVNSRQGCKIRLP